MKKLFLLCFLPCFNAFPGWILGVGYGDRHDDHNTILFLLSRPHHWFSEQPLSYFTQFSFANMTANTDENTRTVGFSFGVGVHYQLERFFLETSVSPSWLTRQTLGGRHQPHGFAFQDFFSIGMRVPKIDTDLRYSYIHYSNGSLFKPNLSFDFQYSLSASILLH